MKKIKQTSTQEKLLQELACEIYDNLAAKMVIALYRERDRATRRLGRILAPQKPKKKTRSHDNK